MSINTEVSVSNYQLAVVKQGIKALLKGFKINRAYNSTNCREFVASITGKYYPAGKNGLEKALNDLQIEIDTIANKQ